jgi:hypothetical protein
MSKQHPTSRQAVLIGLAAVSLVSCAAVPPAGAVDPRSPGALVEDVRRATRMFQDVAAARAAGYAPFLGCVSGPEQGAMGLHFVNGDLVGDGVLDPARPEALMYEPKDGRLRFVGVEYIVLADAWNARNASPPAMMGQVFHYTGSPNRYGIPAFYALHVWAWKQNPHGTFADWNPTVSCDGSTEALAAQETRR